MRGWTRVELEKLRVSDLPLQGIAFLCCSNFLRVYFNIESFDQACFLFFLYFGLVGFVIGSMWVFVTRLLRYKFHRSFVAFLLKASHEAMKSSKVWRLLRVCLENAMTFSPGKHIFILLLLIKAISTLQLHE